MSNQQSTSGTILIVTPFNVLAALRRHGHQRDRLPGHDLRRDRRRRRRRVDPAERRGDQRDDRVLRRRRRVSRPERRRRRLSVLRRRRRRSASPAAGASATIANTAGVWDSVYGSAINVNLNGGEANVVGGGNFVSFGQGREQSGEPLWRDGAMGHGLRRERRGHGQRRPRLHRRRRRHDLRRPPAPGSASTTPAARRTTVYASSAYLILNGVEAQVVGGGDSIALTAPSTVTLIRRPRRVGRVAGDLRTVHLERRQRHDRRRRRNHLRDGGLVDEPLRHERPCRFRHGHGRARHRQRRAGCDRRRRQRDLSQSARRPSPSARRRATGTSCADRARRSR